MAIAFDLKQKSWNYEAVLSAYLAQTTLPIRKDKFPASASSQKLTPLHDAAWWTAHTIL
jgi:hypothetical protein